AITMMATSRGRNMIATRRLSPATPIYEGYDGGKLGAQGRRASRWTAPLRALRTQAQGTTPCAARHSLYLQCRNGLRQRQEVHHVQQYARRCGGVGGSPPCDLTAGH